MKYFLIILSFLITGLVQAETIELRSDIWCPYACDPGSDRPGFMVELAKEIFVAQGLSVNYKLMNWARAITDTREGKFTGIVGASRNDAPDFIFPSVAEGKNLNYFWVRKDESWKFSDLKSLHGKKIGVINSYSYGELIDKEVHRKNPAFIIVSGDEALEKMIHMTKAKRLDGFIENPNVLKYQLTHMPEYTNAFKIAGPNVADDPDLFIAFSPTNKNAKKYAEMISKGVEALRKSGRLKTILAKYGLEDWK